MEEVRIINNIIGILFILCYAHQILWLIVPFLKKDPPHGPAVLHRYAVLIAARNEEAVIPHLIDSIRKQDYPSDLVRIFVAADNCTDRTAEAAEKAGAAVYRRFSETHTGKGYALDFLLRRILKDYGEDAFDGYFVFDADNLLAENYITEMNKTFSDGCSVVTSYRNTKNFGDNWISSGYALWFLREAEFLNRPRMLTGNSCAVSGCGFLFGNNVLKRYGGWPFFLLTEDIEFTVRNILDGEVIGYCGSAEFFDEQPVRFSQSWKQRMRWAKGYLQVIGRYGRDLLRGIRGKNGFSCFDMLMANLPALVLTSVSAVVNLTACFVMIGTGQGLTAALGLILQSFLGGYGFMFFIGVITALSEHRRIRASAGRKLLALLTFPLFMMTYIPIAVVSLFKKVTWVPIEHTAALTIADLNRKQ